MQAAEKLSITLPTDLARTIREKVGSGAYSTQDEFICEAVQAWLEHEQRLEELDRAIEQGIADAEAGRVQDIDSAREELRRHFAA